MGSGAASAKRVPFDNSEAAPSLPEQVRQRAKDRREAAARARTQATRQPARTQAPAKEAPPKASTYQARSQAIRQPARTQATTKEAPAKASIPHARLQAFREARSQAPTMREIPWRTMECLIHKDNASNRARQVQEGVFASRSRAGAVAKARLPGQGQPNPEELPTRSPLLPSSGSSSPPSDVLPSGPSTLPSGGQLTSKTRRGAGVVAPASKAAEPKSRTATGPVDDSALSAGVYEKVRRQGSHGPAYTLKKVSWKFMGGWENVFSPPEGRVVLSPEPEEAEASTRPAPLRVTPAPRYSEIGKTPVRPECARPRRRPMAPPAPASPPRSVHWPSRSETRLTSAGSVAKEGTSVGPRMLGLLARLESLQLSQKLGSANHQVPAHGSAGLKSAFRTGPRKAKAVVRFDDDIQVKVVSRWVTDRYSDYRYSAGAISGWNRDPDWDPNPEHPSDNAHIRVWSSHPEDSNHHDCHRVGYPDGGGDAVWGNVRSCSPHLREINWSWPCPVQTYRLPRHPELGRQGKCSCEVSGTYDCPRKLYRKQLDYAYVNLACRGPKSGKLKALRLVLQRMNWAGGVAVIPSDL
jgi:hypothetical protein